jgi:molecular chaperone HscB
MNIDSDDFTLFGLPQRFALARDEIDARWKALQGKVHPDRFALQGAAAQRVAMQWAVRVNEAYRRLKSPLARAAYLCELRGAPIDAENNTAMPGDFLAQQMHWREALDEAADARAADRLAREVEAERAERLRRIEQLLDVRGDASAAALEVRALMFIERFGEDIEHRLEALEQ